MICDLGKGAKTSPQNLGRCVSWKCQLNYCLMQGLTRIICPLPHYESEYTRKARYDIKRLYPKKIWIVTQYDKNKRVFRNAPRWRCTAIFNATAYSKVCFISLARQYCALNFWIIHQLNDNNIIIIMNISIKSEWIEFKSKLQYHSQIPLDNLL